MFCLRLIVLNDCCSYDLVITIRVGCLHRSFLLLSSCSMVYCTNSRLSLISTFCNSMRLLINLSVSLRSISNMLLNRLVTYISIGISWVCCIPWFLLITYTNISLSIFWLRCILKLRIIRSMIKVNSRISSVMSCIKLSVMGCIKLSTCIIRLVNMCANHPIWWG